MEGLVNLFGEPRKKTVHQNQLVSTFLCVIVWLCDGLLGKYDGAQ